MKKLFLISSICLSLVACSNVEHEQAEPEQDLESPPIPKCEQEIVNNLYPFLGTWEGSFKCDPQTSMSNTQALLINISKIDFSCTLNLKFHASFDGQEIKAELNGTLDTLFLLSEIEGLSRNYTAFLTRSSQPLKIYLDLHGVDSTYCWGGRLEK